MVHFDAALPPSLRNGSAFPEKALKEVIVAPEGQRHSAMVAAEPPRNGISMCEGEPPASIPDPRLSAKISG
jgi:hypothetical protein